MDFPKQQKPGRVCRASFNDSFRILVAVVSWLVWAIHSDTDVLGLIRSQNFQLGTQLGQVQAGNFFIQFLWQHVHADVILAVSVQSAI